MKKFVTTSAAVAVALMGAASNASAADYQVTVTNLTSGIYFTPLIAGAHSPDVALFRAGTEASPELQTMAEGGNVGPLAALLESVGASVATGEGLLAPGATATLTISDSGIPGNTRLSVAGMLLPTNDGFVGLNSVPLPGPGGSSTATWSANGYDAGTEANDEVIGSGAPGEAGFPAPPPVVASGLGTGALGLNATAEGFVSIHRGVIGDLDESGGSSDINAVVHRFLNPVARITVTRMGDAAGGPGAITGLNGLAYSSSTVEIFWDRAESDTSTITGYEIFRDGELVDTRDALSFLDDGLAPGVEHTYEVAAIDADGNVGPRSSVVVSTRL